MTTRVKSLIYKLIPDTSVDYDNAPEIIEETNDFKIRVNPEKAIFELKDHFTSVLDARIIADDYLKRWQVLIGLENNPDDLKFRFENAEYEQIEKEGQAIRSLSAHVSASVVVSDNVGIHISHNHLPNLPHKFKMSPDVITMYQRYKLYRQGKESLTSMAYMCLTILEASARGLKNYNKNNSHRGKASHQYNIDYDVLDDLGKLVSTRGDQIEARKAPKNGVFDPLEQEERDWIIRAIKVLIRRAGEWTYDPYGQHTQITVQDI